MGREFLEKCKSLFLPSGELTGSVDLAEWPDLAGPAVMFCENKTGKNVIHCSPDKARYKQETTNLTELIRGIVIMVWTGKGDS